MQFRVAMIVFRNGVAGHTRSAATIARALLDAGHDVQVLVEASRPVEVFTQAGIDVLAIPRPTLRSPVPLLSALELLQRVKPVDVVHLFTGHGFESAAVFARRHCVPVVQTICGGPVPRAVMPAHTHVVFSEELNNGLERQGLDPANIVLSGHRLDCSGLTATASDAPRLVRTALNRSQVDPDAQWTVLRIARVAPEYERSIDEGVRAVLALHHKGVRARFVHVGVVVDQRTHARVLRNMQRANGEAGRVLAVSVQDGASQASRYLEIADVSIAAGRSAYEAMLAGVPVCVVGPQGYAGVADETSLPALLERNMSGRLPENRPADQSVELLTRKLACIQRDEAYRDGLRSYARRWVTEQLDVRHAPAHYERAWKRATVVARSEPGFALPRLVRFQTDKWLRRAPIYLRRLLLARSPFSGGTSSS